MITNMQFLDNGVYLTVSEVNQDDKIGIFMGEVGQELNELSMELSEVEIIRLRNWLNEAVEILGEEIKSKTPS